MRRLIIALSAVPTSIACAVPAYALSSSDIPTPDHDIVAPASPLSSELGTTGLLLTAPFNSEPGPIREQFGQAGPHPVAATLETTDCGPFYSFYGEVLRLSHGVNVPPDCYGVAPEGPNSPVGYQFIYPTDLTPGEKAPLMLLSPGIGVEPGMMHRHAQFYASHGYIVAMGYCVTNWFGDHLLFTAGATKLADENPESPLYQHIDFSRTVVAGHSAGGGSAVRVANTTAPFLHAIGRAEANVVGVIGINPGPSDFGLASAPSTAPTLILPAEHETLVPHPTSRIGFNRATGPKWWAMVKGASHGEYLDDGSLSIYDSVVVAFADYVTQRTAKATAVFEGEGFLLGNDPELIDVERY